MAAPRTAQAILAQARAFIESRILLTALELDAFTAVGTGATLEEAAARMGGEPRATGMLLNALVGLGAMEKREGRYACTSETLSLGPGRHAQMHLVNRWRPWSGLTQCIRTGAPASPEHLGGEDPRWTEAFIEAMRVRALTVAPDLVAKVGAQGAGRMLDVGGGPATFALAFAAANPGLKAEVLDIPAVVPIARRHIAEAGLEGRVSARAGDLRSDPLGENYDLILVSAICHMLDEAGNRDLLRRCGEALAPGGRLVIRDYLLEPDRAGPPEATVFALNMLVATPGGNTYTEGEYRQWLEAAGLGEVLRLGDELLVARRPL